MVCHAGANMCLSHQHHHVILCAKTDYMQYVDAAAITYEANFHHLMFSSTDTIRILLNTNYTRPHLV